MNAQDVPPRMTPIPKTCERYFVVKHTPNERLAGSIDDKTNTVIITKKQRFWDGRRGFAVISRPSRSYAQYVYKYLRRKKKEKTNTH